MQGMRLGGIDPSILRELSGVYKPFIKAFKELVSNSFDADADQVEVAIANDFASIKVRDDGAGMTPFEFRSDFTRIGGGSRRWSGDRLGKADFVSVAKGSDSLRLRDTAASFRLRQCLAGTILFWSHWKTLPARIPS